MLKDASGGLSTKACLSLLRSPPAGCFSARRKRPRAPEDVRARPLDVAALPRDRGELVGLLRVRGNDLEQTAIALAPLVAEALAALRALPACELARMSGSGATCFGIFGTASAALAAARQLRASHPRWWVCATVLG